MNNQFDATIARLPKLLFALAAVGTVAGFVLRGLMWTGGFAIGSFVAWLNLRLIERAVDSMALSATAGERGGPGGFGVFIRFSALTLGAFGILRFSGFSGEGAVYGFFTFPSAVILAILYELASFKNHKT